MWSELREEVEVELQMLEEHLRQFSALRRKALEQTPDEVERLALAAMLNAFYNGVENVFKRIAHHCDGGVPAGARWHQTLLGAMASGTVIIARILWTWTRLRLPLNSSLACA
mgnify:CR=1 FL=1